MKTLADVKRKMTLGSKWRCVRLFEGGKDLGVREVGKVQGNDLVAQKHCTGCGVLLIGGREQDMLSADISMPPASCQSDGIFHKLSCPWCKAVAIKKLFVHKIHPLKCLRQSFVLATFLTVLRLVILAFLSLLYSYAQDKFSLQIFL